MGYKRAQWRSGLTYHQICPNCKNEMFYTDDRLGFRAWFPDGFVYCERCRKPLRHSEQYAVGAPAPQQLPQQTDVVMPQPSEPISAGQTPGVRFCSNCGQQCRTQDRFCSSCGNMLTG